MASYMLDLDMGLDQMARVFRDNGWEYATNGTYGVPDQDALGSMIATLVSEMDERNLSYVRRGRIALVRDPEVNGTFQVLLVAGYAYNPDVEPF